MWIGGRYLILLYGIVVSMSYNKALFEYRMSKTCNASMFITAILLDIINDSAHSSCENNEAKVFWYFRSTATNCIAVMKLRCVLHSPCCSLIEWAGLIGFVYIATASFLPLTCFAIYCTTVLCCKVNISLSLHGWDCNMVRHCTPTMYFCRLGHTYLVQHVMSHNLLFMKYWWVR